VKGYTFSLYALEFIGVSNCNRVPGKRSMFQFGSDRSKIYEVYELILIISLHTKKENQHEDVNEVYSQYINPDPEYSLFAT
jgi:hypothetical protein